MQKEATYCRGTRQQASRKAAKTEATAENAAQNAAIAEVWLPGIEK